MNDTARTPPRYMREFPGFDAMPPVDSAWIDTSWRNDTCPSFQIAGTPYGAAVRLFVDYADQLQREDATGSRFTMYATDNGNNEVRPIYNGDDWREVVALARVERLAWDFAVRVANDLTADEWQDMRALNSTYDKAICATHDFRDANMTMQESFIAVTGRDPVGDIMHDDDLRLWSDAWNIAKDHYLTATEGIENARFDAWRLTAADGELEDAEGKPMSVRGYANGSTLEPFGTQWHCAVANVSELFDSLFLAELFLWDMHASREDFKTVQPEPINPPAAVMVDALDLLDCVTVAERDGDYAGSFVVVNDAGETQRYRFTVEAN